jgi:hypothetical protein
MCKKLNNKIMLELHEIETEYDEIKRKVSRLHSLYNSRVNTLSIPYKNLVLIQIKALELYETTLAQTLIIMRNE